ncbi:MAG TPA: ATP-binding protein, partial [Nocardioides sp.]|nr:ATP-binding protein [Nocardioides sp.]
MQRTAGEVGASSGIEVWARDAFEALTGLPGVWRVGLALTEGGGRRLLFTASDRGLGTVVPWCHVDAFEDVPLTTVVRTGEPVHGRLDELDERYAGFVARQRATPTLALAAVPITAAGQTLGGFVLFFSQPPAFDREQRTELARTGARLGTALREARQQGAAPTVAPAEPPPQGDHVAVHHVPPDSAGVAAARRFVRSTLEEWGLDHETIEVAVLCASELVTNALMHAHTGCTVRLVMDQGVLRTTVHDSGTTAAAAVEPV